MVTIEVTTLAGAKHSGQFGGAAPDALIVVLHALATLHDDNGDVAVEGLRREAWAGESYSEDEFRELAEVRAGLPLHGHRRPRLARLVGPGDHRHRHRRAVGRRCAQRRLPVRAREDQPARAPRAGRRRGPGRARPPPRGACGRSGSRSRSHAGETGNGFAARTSGPAYEAARAAMAGGLGQRPGERGGRRLDPARQRAAGRGARGRGAARRHHRRLREHPRARRARAARRAREGGRGARPSSSAAFAAR